MLGSGSGDRLLIMPLDAGWPTSLPATLHIGVESWASAWATSGSNAEFTLVASGLTPTQLLAGSPQTGSVAYGEGAFYRFSTSPTERGPISIAVSASGSDDPDLFLAASSSPVSKEACTSGAVVCWKSMALGADGIHVEPDDPNYCSGCDYSLLVYGAGPYASNSIDYTLRLLFEYTLITLQDGHPVGGKVRTGDYKFYRMLIDDSNSSIALQLTTFSGDADLYSSFIEQRPTKGKHNFSSTSGGGSDDSVQISRTDRHFCAVLPCYLYVGVYGVCARVEPGPPPHHAPPPPRAADPVLNLWRTVPQLQLLARWHTAPGGDCASLGRPAAARLARGS